MPHEMLRALRWDAEGDARLRGLSPAEWTMLTDTVEEGLGLHLLARRLHRSEVVVPADITARLRKNTIMLAARNLQGRAIMADVIRNTGQPALLLKGIDLAERLYGNLGHRAMGDIDFLVRPEDVPAYHSELLAKDYRPNSTPDAQLIAARREHHTFYAPTLGSGSLPLELHWRLSSGRHDDAVDVEGIWSRTLPHPTFANDARIMAGDDLFLYLCLHLKHHTFEAPLTALWDLAELLSAPTMLFDWPTIWQRASEWRLTDSVRIVLYLVTNALGVPTERLSDWRPDAQLAKLLPDPMDLLGGHSRMIRFSGARIGMVLAGTEPWRQRVRALASGLLPSRQEIRMRYGTPNQNRISDIRSYVRRLTTIWRSKWRFAIAFASNADGTRDSTDRLTRLRSFLQKSL